MAEMCAGEREQLSTNRHDRQGAREPDNQTDPRAGGQHDGGSFESVATRQLDENRRPPRLQPRDAPIARANATILRRVGSHCVQQCRGIDDPIASVEHRSSNRGEPWLEIMQCPRVDPFRMLGRARSKDVGLLVIESDLEHARRIEEHLDTGSRSERLHVPRIHVTGCEAEGARWSRGMSDRRRQDTSGRRRGGTRLIRRGEKNAQILPGERRCAGEADEATPDDDDIGLKHRGRRARSTHSNRLELNSMLRTIFTIGALAVLGLFLLSSVFGILKGLIALALFLLGLAIRIAIVGLIVYLVIRIVSPETARRLRERWSGPTA